MKTARSWIAAVLACGALGACASVGPSEADRLALVQAHAGAPVKQIRNREAMGWDRVDGSHVLLNMRPTESWLLELSGNCLDWGNGSPGLQILSTSDWLVGKFDRVKVIGSPVTCMIREIRPVDVKALRAAETSLRAQGVSGT